MSCSRMLSEDENIWEEKEGELEQERGEKTEEEQSALEELFPSGRNHQQISMENNPGKSLREVRVGDGQSERRKFQDLLEDNGEVGNFEPKTEKITDAWGSVRK